MLLEEIDEEEEFTPEEIEERRREEAVHLAAEHFERTSSFKIKREPIITGNSID